MRAIPPVNFQCEAFSDSQAFRVVTMKLILPPKISQKMLQLPSFKLVDKKEKTHLPFRLLSICSFKSMFL
ncbi:hypothetical protein QN277_019702 [Acacia crassicarpa]|uniref:Uncharacterized protein n=1 Tax=Acacia crassicarpa TaxID=499986 RepID=A0AAE1MRB1_9FABA|nr:hypothetical protein QN277_019702 [Acacia crassicarpa]